MGGPLIRSLSTLCSNFSQNRGVGTWSVMGAWNVLHGNSHRSIVMKITSCNVWSQHVRRILVVCMHACVTEVRCSTSGCNQETPCSKWSCNLGAATETDAIGEQQLKQMQLGSSRMDADRHVDKHGNLLSCCLFLRCSSCHSSSVSKRLMKGWWNGLLHWCTNIQRHCLMWISGSFLDLFSVESYGLSCHRRMGSPCQFISLVVSKRCTNHVHKPGWRVLWC